jgi:biotin transporter BioY
VPQPAAPASAESSRASRRRRTAAFNPTSTAAAIHLVRLTLTLRRKAQRSSIIAAVPSIRELQVMPHDVFVSYSSGDKPTADAVCATLERRGIRCWMAPRDILPGVDWGGAIVDAINASTVMVLVYSARANDSPQIKREVERAVHRGLPIIPFRIEDVPMSKTLEYFMSMPHWLDALTPPLQDHLDRLAETTRLILERAGPVLPPPPRGSATESPPVVQPLTTSRGIAREIGRWAIGGTESPTLAAVFVPGSDRIANAALIAASVVAIAILAQMHVGPIWLQPLAVLVTGAALGSRRGALAAAIYVGLGILGLPVFARGVSAWTSVNHSAPYVRYGLGYLAGLIAAAFAVGWLSERRAWDRHRANAARLALAGIALFYLPGVLWIETAALLMREPRAPAGVLPSISMLVITAAVLTYGLPRAWVAALSLHRRSESPSAAVPAQTAPTETTHTRPPQ